VPDEGNYAEIIREMAETGNYVTPYLNGIKFFEKPVLLYWLGAFAIKIGGVNLWALRSSNAFFALLTCVMIYLTGRKLYNRQTGLLAALILGSSMLFFSLAHMLTTDMLVSSFITFTFCTFILGIDAKAPLERFLYFSGSAIFAGFAVLAKGLIGIVLPMLIIGFWILLLKEWKIFKKINLIWCAFLFLLIVLPWHLLVSLDNPEFFYLYFIQHHVLRFATTIVGHPQPMWYYVPVLLVGFFPWIVFLPQSIKNSLQIFSHKSEKEKITFFLFLWALIVFLFFTIATSKLVSYILPAFPPLALLTSHFLQQNKNARFEKNMRISFIALFIFSLIIAAFLTILPKYWIVADMHLANVYLRTAALFLILGMSISFYFSRKVQYFNAIVTTFGTTCIVLLVLLASLPYVDSQSISTLTDILKPQLKNADKVIAYNHHYQDLPFYLEKQVMILNSRKLFKYGMQFQKNHDWMIEDAEFEKIWPSRERVFAFMRNEDFNVATITYPQYTFKILGRTPLNVLVSNHE
jgi:4-amino-4-deoxy-L-arabinose transferase-like glycosyltransferase